MRRMLTAADRLRRRSRLAAVVFAVIGVFVFVALRKFESRSILPNTSFEGRCVAVTDGDTIRVLRGRDEIRVRLHGIDCPERGQPFANVAKDYMSEATFGKELRVVAKGTDRNKRIIGIVYSEGVDVNATIVDAGLAWAFRKYSLDYVPNETRARTARVGLWSEPSQTPPWEWRKVRRELSN